MNNDHPLSPAEAVLSEKPSKPKRKRELLSNLVLFASALLLALLLNVFVFQSYEVDGQSMEPTLQNQDRLIIYKFGRTWSRITGNEYLPSRGDIIVFHKPNGSSEQLIKRVIALPGERVVVKNSQITVFNQENPNGFNPDSADWGGALQPTYGNVDVTVADKEVFVVGDNRIAGASYDSRSTLGNVPTHFIVGKLVLRYLPFGNVTSF